MNISFKNYKAGLVIPIIVSIIGIHSAVFSKFEIPNWLPSISITTIITVLFILYDRIIWKVAPFLVNVRNVSGRYEGKIKSTYSDALDLDVVIEISQKASSIFVRQYTKNGTAITSSFSNNESVILLPDNTVEVSFSYKNNGLETSKMIKEHKGFCVLNISIDGQKIDGYYFTNRDPQTKGSIMSTLISKEIKGYY